jgi:hypothetical protein
MPPVNRNQPRRSESSESRYSLMEFMRDFPDDATCLEWLWTTRYAPDGKHADCPKCELRREFKRYETSQQRQSWTCTACGFHLHPTAGTIFHKSSTSLHLWFYAMYLMTSTRCGISAKQLEAEPGTFRALWNSGPLIDGAPLPRLELTKPDPQVYVDLKATGAVVLQLKDIRPLGVHPTLMRIRREVGVVCRYLMLFGELFCLFRPVKDVHDSSSLYREGIVTSALTGRQASPGGRRPLPGNTTLGVVYSAKTTEALA